MKVADPVQRGRTLLGMRRWAEAEREFRGALAQEPQHVAAHALLGLALVQQGKTAEAVEEAQEAVRLAPDQWLPHFAAAQVYHRAHRPDEALAACRAALNLHPEYATIWEVLARIHLARGEWPLMAGAARRGLELDPEDADLASLLSLAYTNLGDAEQAGGAAAHAVRLDPESATAHFVRGHAALRFGDPRDAAEAFREVLRLDPGFGRARDLLVRALKQRNPVHRRLEPLRRRFRGGWWMVLLLPAIPPMIAVFVLIALLHWAAWVAESWTILRLARGKATRLLFEQVEARMSLLCCCLVPLGAALLALGIALGHDATAVAGVGVMALVTPLQEAAHTGTPVRRAVLYGWAALLCLALAAAVAFSTFAVALLAVYAGLATIWVAALVRGRHADAGL
ncbi:tetratricopeptide repeat protein [Nonomuraea terrae]|uniref:tetratricopeptide repeat protein n=1 Tax=Nonomuraea terrae TaxID=2530383 RepID=UPI0037939D65